MVARLTPDQKAACSSHVGIMWQTFCCAICVFHCLIVSILTFYGFSPTKWVYENFIWASSQLVFLSTHRELISVLIYLVKYDGNFKMIRIHRAIMIKFNNVMIKVMGWWSQIMMLAPKENHIFGWSRSTLDCTVYIRDSVLPLYL